MLPPGIFINETNTSDTSIVFSMFNFSDLYPLLNKSAEEFDVASTVVSATVVGSENSEMLPVNVTIVLLLHIEVRPLNFGACSKPIKFFAGFETS